MTKYLPLKNKNKNSSLHLILSSCDNGVHEILEFA
jgi:hypothetical protein